MKNLSGVFLRALTFFSLLFTVPKLIQFFFFPTYIHDRIWPPLDWLLMSGLISGVGAAVFLTIVQIIYVRNRARKHNIDSSHIDYGIHPSLEMEVTRPLLPVFMDLKTSLSNLPWKITYQDENKGVLQFKVTRKWQVPDELVTIRLEPTQVQRTTVKVDSKTDSWIGLIDTGHNLNNIQQVRQALSQ